MTADLHYPPRETLDRLIDYHDGIAASDMRLSKSLAKQAGIETRRHRNDGEPDISAGLEMASNKNRARSNYAEKTVLCLALLRSIAYPPAPARLHPDRPTKVFTGHMKRSDETSPKLRLPP